MTKAIENDLYPMHVFRFHVEFKEQMLTSDSEGSEVILCSGAFAECSGLEATMEPKVIKEGGRNWGAHQRAGQVTFATLILKRGMTSTKDLWKWFDLVGQGRAETNKEGKFTVRRRTGVCDFSANRF